MLEIRIDLIYPRILEIRIDLVHPRILKIGILSKNTGKKDRFTLFKDRFGLSKDSKDRDFTQEYWK